MVDLRRWVSVIKSGFLVHHGELFPIGLLWYEGELRVSELLCTGGKRINVGCLSFKGKLIQSG